MHRSNTCITEIKQVDAGDSGIDVCFMLFIKCACLPNESRIQKQTPIRRRHKPLPRPIQNLPIAPTVVIVTSHRDNPPMEAGIIRNQIRRRVARADEVLAQHLDALVYLLPSWGCEETLRLISVYELSEELLLL
jgi:hypothetical protein